MRERTAPNQNLEEKERLRDIIEYLLRTLAVRRAQLTVAVKKKRGGRVRSTPRCFHDSRETRGEERKKQRGGGGEGREKQRGRGVRRKTDASQDIEPVVCVVAAAAAAATSVRRNAVDSKGKVCAR